MQIFADGDPQIQNFAQGTFWQVIHVGTDPVLLCVRSRGDVEQPVLEYSVTAARDLGVSERAEGGRKAARILTLGVDLERFYHETEGDPVLHTITRELRGLRTPTTESVFEALVDSIIEQQISLQVAWTMQERLIRAFGDPLTVGTQTFYGFPSPSRLAGVTSEQMRTTGLSRRKIEYIRGVASLIEGEGFDLEHLGDGRDSSAVLDSLQEIRGVGRWTAELTLVRGMQRFDAFPADDLGLRRHIGRFYRAGEHVNAEEARAIAERWGAWKGLAGFYLIVADRSGVEGLD
jgi:DNA-3-methyladenine glycosylase II